MTEPRRPRPPVQELQDIAYRAVSLLLLLQNRRLRATEVLIAFIVCVAAGRSKVREAMAYSTTISTLNFYTSQEDLQL